MVTSNNGLKFRNSQPNIPIISKRLPTSYSS